MKAGDVTRNLVLLEDHRVFRLVQEQLEMLAKLSRDVVVLDELDVPPGRRRALITWLRSQNYVVREAWWGQARVMLREEPKEMLKDKMANVLLAAEIVQSAIGEHDED